MQKYDPIKKMNMLKKQQIEKKTMYVFCITGLKF